MTPKDPKNDRKSEFDELVLEAPPAAESPGSGAGTLFADDSLAATAAKLATLEAMSALLIRSYEFQDFMRELLLSIMKVVKSEAGSILELNHDNQSLFFRATVGQSSDTVCRFVIPVGQGVVGHVAESRQPLAVDDVKGHSRHLKSIPSAVGFDPRNMVAVPIIIRGRVYGVLELLNRVGEDHYTAEDVELLSYLCVAAARTIEVRLVIGWALQASKGSGTGSVAA